MGIIPLAKLTAVAACLQLASAAPFDFFGQSFGFGRGSFSGSGRAPNHGQSSGRNNGQSSSATTSSTAASSIATSTSTVIDGNCANTASTRQCWGGGYYIGTDAETSWPTTGVTRSYTLEITNITLSPDGTERTVFAINGQYPGPTIEAGM